MAKYTEAELIELRSTAVVPTTLDFLAFTKAIEEQRLVQAELDAAQSSRRRSSVHGNRPKFTFVKRTRPKHEAPKPDEDGWVTLNKKEEGAVTQQKETFREQIRDQKVNKIKANSKKMASASGGDARDLLPEKSNSKFNAFAALNSESDEDDDEEDEEDEEEED